MINKEYTPKEIEMELGVKHHKLKHWDKMGTVVAKRTDKNRRFYTSAQVQKIKRLIKLAPKDVLIDRPNSVISIRPKEQIRKQIEEDVQSKGTDRSKVISGILEDHYEHYEDRSAQETIKQLNRIMPDLQRQRKEFSKVTKALQQSMELNQKLYGYIADQKSAESFYFREIDEKVTSMTDMFNVLLKELGKEPLKEETAKTGSVVDQLMGKTR
jgi:DNA-binding transcriptional MerR regulator